MAELTGHIREGIRKASLRDMVMLGIAIFDTVASTTAVFMSLWLPPAGVIDSSVLMYAGINFTFIGSLLGISAHFDRMFLKN